MDAVRATVAELQDPAHVHPLAEDAYLVKELTKILGRLGESHVDVVLDVCLSLFVACVQGTLQIGQACDYPFALLNGSCHHRVPPM